MYLDLKYLTINLLIWETSAYRVNKGELWISKESVFKILGTNELVHFNPQNSDIFENYTNESQTLY